MTRLTRLLLLLLIAAPVGAQTALQVEVDAGAGAGVRIDNVTATYYPPPTINLDGRLTGNVVRITGQVQELQGVALEGLELVFQLEDPLGDEDRVYTRVYRAIEAAGVLALDEELEGPAANYRVRIRPVRVKRPAMPEPRIIFPSTAPAVAVSWQSDPQVDITSAAGLWDRVTRRLRLTLSANVGAGVAGAELVITTLDDVDDETGSYTVRVEPRATMTVDVEMAAEPASVRVHVGRLVMSDGRVDDGRILELEARHSPDLEVRRLRGTCSSVRCRARFHLGVLRGAPAAAEISIALQNPFGDEIHVERRTAFRFGVAFPHELDLPAPGWSLVVSVDRVRLGDDSVWVRPELQ